MKGFMKDTYKINYDDEEERVLLFVNGSDSAISLNMRDTNKIIDSIRNYEIRGKIMDFPKRIDAGSYMVNSTSLRIRHHNSDFKMTIGAKGLFELCDDLAGCAKAYSLRLSENPKIGRV